MSTSDPKMRGWRSKEKRLIVSSYFTVSLIFFFFLVFHPSKACICPLGCNLPRPPLATAGDGTECVMTRILQERWLSSVRKAVPKSSGPFTSHDLVLLITSSPSDPEPSLAWFHLPSLSMAHRFLNSAWRSSWWFGPIHSQGLGLLPLSVCKGSETFSTPFISPLLSTQT